MATITTSVSPLSTRHALFVAMAVALSSTSSFALGDDAQRAACTPDVFRLCSSAIPSVDRIVACLKREKPNLSPGCQAVFKNSEQRSASRALDTPEIEWCTFGHVVNPSQDNWLKWCGAAAHSK